MRHLIAFALLAQHQPDRWFGADKVKHFLLSAMVESVTVSTARGTGMSPHAARVIGASLTASVGIGREIHDHLVGKGASAKDLAWDGLGGVAAASLLNGAR